jgi:hypothetical protein
MRRQQTFGNVVLQPYDLKPKLRWEKSQMVNKISRIMRISLKIVGRSLFRDKIFAMPFFTRLYFFSRRHM